MLNVKIFTHTPWRDNPDSVRYFQPYHIQELERKSQIYPIGASWVKDDEFLYYLMSELRNYGYNGARPNAFAIYDTFLKVWAKFKKQKLKTKKLLRAKKFQKFENYKKEKSL